MEDDLYTTSTSSNTTYYHVDPAVSTATSTVSSASGSDATYVYPSTNQWYLDDRSIRITLNPSVPGAEILKTPYRSAFPATVSYTDKGSEPQQETSKTNWACYWETLRELQLGIYSDGQRAPGTVWLTDDAYTLNVAMPDGSTYTI
jgi:hypothetical protein